MEWLNYVALAFILAFALFFSQSHVQAQDLEIAKKRREDEEKEAELAAMTLDPSEEGTPCHDRLQEMFMQQEQFMQLLQKHRNFPEFPMDLSKKASQREIKKISFEAMGELFEAVQHLKNSKDHRATDIGEFDRPAYVEEIADTWHYLIEIVILSGISLEELYDAYISKGRINCSRITGGY